MYCLLLTDGLKTRVKNSSTKFPTWQMQWRRSSKHEEEFIYLFIYLLVKHWNRLPMELIGGVTTRGGVQEMSGRGTKCFGLVDKTVTGQRLDLMI